MWDRYFLNNSNILKCDYLHLLWNLTYKYTLNEMSIWLVFRYDREIILAVNYVLSTSFPFLLKSSWQIGQKDIFVDVNPSNLNF